MPKQDSNAYTHLASHAEEAFDDAGKTPVAPKKPKRPGPRPAFDPTPEQEDYLHKHVMVMTDKQLAAQLRKAFAIKVSSTQVASWRRRNKIRRTTGTDNKETKALAQTDEKPTNAEMVLKPSEGQLQQLEADAHIRIAVMSGLVPSDMSNIPPITRQRLERLRRYICLPKFRLMYENLMDAVERDYFLSDFANHVWDIEELDPAEMNRVLDLIMLNVRAARLERAEKQAYGLTDDDSHGVITQEYIRYHKDIEEQKKVVNAQLHLTREQRLKHQEPHQISFTTVVEGWVDMDRRAQLLAHARKARQERKVSEKQLEDLMSKDPRVVILGLQNLDSEDQPDGKSTEEQAI